MKKHLGKILLIVLIVVCMAATLAACDDNTGSGGNQDGNSGTDPSAATFTVTFSAGAGNSLEGKYDLKDVAYGSTVATPKDSAGNKLVPTRTGYVFDYWEDADGEEFIFSDDSESRKPDTVTSNIALTAHWTAATYTHSLITWSDEYLTLPAGVKIELADGAAFRTTYGTKTAANIPVPTVTNEDGSAADDWFAYWFYLDADGNEVQFTTWSDKDGSAVSLLEEYSFPYSLTLYPKLHSALPDYKVTFGTGYDDGSLFTLTKKLGDTLDGLAEGDIPSRAGYEFGGWFYTVTTGEGDDAVTTEHEFVFAASKDEGEDGGSAAEAEPTRLTADIAVEGDEGYTLGLYAKWIRVFDIASADDMSTMKTAIDAALGVDEAELGSPAAIEKDAVLDAKINFAQNADITLADWAPVYDNDNPFTGTLTGNGAKVRLNYGSSFTGNVLALFGANAGTVTGIEIGVSVAELPTTEESFVAVGTLAGRTSGVVNGVAVYLQAGAEDAPLLADGKALYIGGLAAEMAFGTDISSLTVKGASVFVKNATVLCAGGIAGTSVYGAGDSTSSVKSSVVESFVVDSTADTAYIGGAMGALNSVTVSESGVKDFEITVTASTLFAGGFCGKAEKGDLSECYADGTILADGMSKPSSIGGLVGENASLIGNCRTNCTVTAQAQAGGELYVGGIAGKAYRANANASTSSESKGDINASYSTGSITVTVAEGGKATVYAGGTAGMASTMRSSRSFTDVAVTVTNAGTNRVGAHMGARFNTITLEKCYYATDAAVTVNGEPAQAVTSEGLAGTEKANFADIDWLTDDSGFNLDRSVWTVDGDGNTRLAFEIPAEDSGDDAE